MAIDDKSTVDRALESKSDNAWTLLKAKAEGELDQVILTTQGRLIERLISETAASNRNGRSPRAFNERREFKERPSEFKERPSEFKERPPRR